ncbi:MAG: hypothetical protein JWO51_2830 [Rhodospirillales bacterium]|nr:hypothetical protein [Rhodospirillales bacterium]
MTTAGEIRTEIRATDGQAGAIAAFPYDRLTVERFRQAFPRARWSDDLRAWVVPGKTAERRLDRWLGRELSGVLVYADQRGRDAFAFDPIQSKYLTVSDGFEIRTPFSRTIQAELREVPWAWWDSDKRIWRVPFRSWEDLRRRWPTIEAAAVRNEPEQRKTRRDAKRGSTEWAIAREDARERRKRRYPVPADALPPFDAVVMTMIGSIIVTDIAGELVEAELAQRHYPGVSTRNSPLVWATWRRPSHDELVQTWPSRQSPTEVEISRGWWAPTLVELRRERRKARSIERAAATRREPSP